MPKIHPLVLASGSPRRSEILQRLCIPFEVSPADIDETPKKDEGAKAMVLRLAKGKAAAAVTKFPGRWVLAADSIVAQNGRPFGKPKTKNDAAHILHRLSGKKHQVFTAICLRKDDEIHSTI